MTKSLCTTLLCSIALFAQDDSFTPPPAKSTTPLPLPPREQARSMIVTRYGIVAASQFLASQAGSRILEAGGNAIDAAIAANAVLGLTQPYVNGVGGDLFAIVYEAKTGKIYGLNSSRWTPKALTIDYLKSKKIDRIGVHAITVPGCVAGWDALLRRFGTKSLSELLAPAVFYAENGFPLPEFGARSWISQPLLRQPGYEQTYMPGGVQPQLGDVFKNPALGETLRQIAAKGRDGFYRGKLAESLVGFLQAQGGAHTLEDFAEFQPEWVEPISTSYRGWQVYELPPNGQGIAALSMLNIMENFPLKDYGHNSAAALHVMIEAKKLAYADMAHYVGDPRFGPVPVPEMLSKELGKRRASLINMDQASCKVLPSEIRQDLAAHGRETIYLSTIDREGNIVSMIQSNYAGYGTGMVAPGAGFSFHNRGAGFDLEPGKPNSLAGRKRPLHTIIPAFMRKGEISIGFGIMGGWTGSRPVRRQCRRFRDERSDGARISTLHEIDIRRLRRAN
ncbi:MAG: gamma-glutamyltranspeptidase / glutathione hydrolase [Bryobacterales bacterium]|nr:gamma-glutamyltranspeptidase / glutathione hydrolase [Bryobacterales bacterium]